MASTEERVQDEGDHAIDLDDLFIENGMRFFEYKVRRDWEELTKTVDYSRLLIKTEDCVFKETQPKRSSYHIVFNTTYSNNTDNEHTYTLNIERTTRNITTVKLNTEIHHSGNIGLKLKLPGDICELEGSYTREVALNRESEASQEEEMVWSANTEIKVPPKTDTTVELEVEEQEYIGNFECYLKVFGSVVICVSKGERELQRITLCNVEKNRLLLFGKETKRFRISGNCSIRRGLRQRINLWQCPNKNKLQLVNLGSSLFEHLVKELKWRLAEGRGEALYELGVEEDEKWMGLSPEELEESIGTLQRMAEQLGATTRIIRERVLHSKGSSGDAIGSNRKVVEMMVRRVPDKQPEVRD